MASRRSGQSFVLTLAVLVASVIVGCQSAPSGPIGGSVKVVGSWSGAEEQAFLAMVRPFEQDTGITVDYQGTRDLNGLLWEGVAKGKPPDVAGLPGPGQMAEFARHGSLKDLSSVIDVSHYKADTVPTFIDLGTVDGKLVGVFIKATLKGLIWYNPNVYTLAAPANWIELIRDANLARRGDAKTWCMSLGSDATTGWPGTDWIEDIVLRQSGPAAYDDWVAGRLPWSAPEAVPAGIVNSGTLALGPWVAVVGGAETCLRTRRARHSVRCRSGDPGANIHAGGRAAAALEG